MITNLYIKHIAVIDELNIEFHDGLTVLTGETGAGKSIIIDSLNLILGARSAKELIRHGEDSAMVQLAVSGINEPILRILEENGIDDDDGNLIISRQISLDGKNICRINSQMVTSSVLRELSPFIADIHGQHDNQTLMNKDKHIGFLDSYAGNTIAPVMEQYCSFYSRYNQTCRKIDTLSGNEQARLNRIDLLKYQIDELEKAALVIGEDEELKQRKSVIENIEKIASNACGAYENLYNSENTQTAYDGISTALSMLETAKNYDENLDGIYQRLYDLMYELQSVCEDVADYNRSLSFDPAELDEIMQRLDVVNNIKRKYGGDIEKALDYLQTSKAELETLQNAAENLEELEKEKTGLEKSLYSLGKELTSLRLSYAQKLQNAVTEQLKDLDMPKAEFVVEVVTGNTLTSSGLDDAEFLFTANPGHPPKPMTKIASGGELSRIMLALKTVFMDDECAQLMVFDEIDTGVSGSAAAKLAKKLAHISTERQTVCITHLPQLAAMADNHYVIEKTVTDSVTSTSLYSAEGDARKRLLAQMMSADAGSSAALKYAQELIEKANTVKTQL